LALPLLGVDHRFDGEHCDCRRFYLLHFSLRNATAGRKQGRRGERVLPSKKRLATCQPIEERAKRFRDHRQAHLQHRDCVELPDDLCPATLTWLVNRNIGMRPAGGLLASPCVFDAVGDHQLNEQQGRNPVRSSPGAEDALRGAELLARPAPTSPSAAHVRSAMARYLAPRSRSRGATESHFQHPTSARSLTGPPATRFFARTGPMNSIGKGTDGTW
jgi:hypothetical protein